MYQAITGRAAMADKDSFGRVIDRFQAAAEPYEEQPAVAIAANEKVREWFIANGIPIA